MKPLASPGTSTFLLASRAWPNHSYLSPDGKWVLGVEMDNQGEIDPCRGVLFDGTGFSKRRLGKPFVHPRAEPEALNFSGGRLGQLGKKLDPVRPFEDRQAAQYERF